MLEDITLSISTFVFLICSLLISSLAPAEPSISDTPAEKPEAPAEEIVCSAAPDPARILCGVWECFGRTLEFTPSGRLIIEGEVLRYRLDADRIIIDGVEMPLEILSEHVIRFDGKTLYKIKSD